jgi:hypothetical protein
LNHSSKRELRSSIFNGDGSKGRSFIRNLTERGEFLPIVKREFVVPLNAEDLKIE